MDIMPSNSSYDSAGELCQKLATLFSVPLTSIDLGGGSIDGERYQFLCVFLRFRGDLGFPFERKIALIDYIFHRLEKVCYDFARRVLPHVFELMFLEEHDEIDLIDWQFFLEGYEYPNGTVTEGMAPSWVRWMSWLKDYECLDELQCVLKVLHYDQCGLENNREQAWSIIADDRLVFEKALKLTWTPCLTCHQFLHYTARALQKACFEFWRKHKSPNDPNSWTSPSQVQLQDWYYKYHVCLTAHVPKDNAPVVYDLLAAAKSLRNADCHRHYEKQKSIVQWKDVSVQLLDMLDVRRDIANLNIAERLLHASRVSLHKRNMEYYGPDVSWQMNAMLAESLGSKYTHGYGNWDLPYERHLHEMFENAQRRCYPHFPLYIDSCERNWYCHVPAGAVGENDWGGYETPEWSHIPRSDYDGCTELRKTIESSWQFDFDLQSWSAEWEEKLRRTKFISRPNSFSEYRRYYIYRDLKSEIVLRRTRSLRSDWLRPQEDEPQTTLTRTLFLRSDCLGSQEDKQDGLTSDDGYFSDSETTASPTNQSANGREMTIQQKPKWKKKKNRYKKTTQKQGSTT